MLLPKKRLKPRTFRAAVGQTVFIGGLVRIDVAESPGATLYITVWASDEVICHFGRTEAADDRWGLVLQHTAAQQIPAPRRFLQMSKRV